VVLAFGNSVTYGTGAAPGEDWPALLAALTGWQVINAGIPGDTAEAGKGRIKALLDEHRPALVIIEMGGNDFLRRRPANAIKEDLRLIVRLARDAGSQVVLIGVPELSLLAVVAGKPSDSTIFRALAEEEKISLVSDVFSDVLARPELCADRIHPNAEGYRRMAAGIHAQLQRIGLS
jgi:acyl-CoA thioesterase I